MSHIQQDYLTEDYTGDFKGRLTDAKGNLIKTLNVFMSGCFCLGTNIHA